MTTIDITLSLTSPLFVAYPDNYDDIKKVSYTTKQAVMVDGKVHMIPYYPANGFRGGLRRKACARLVEHFVATEGPIPADLYLGLSCGASSGSPDNTSRSIEELIRCRDNVYMGLFGGGARLFASAFRVSDMLPILAQTVRTKMIPAHVVDLLKTKILQGEPGDGQGFQHSPEFDAPWRMLNLRTSIRIDDLQRVSDAEQITRFIEDPIKSVAEHQMGVAENAMGRKADAAVKKTSVANMMTYECIAAGVPFHFRIDLDATADEAKLGLLLLCLSDLFRENAFGGWVRCGFGKVHVEQFIVGHNDETRVWESLYDEKGDFTLPDEAAPFTEQAKAAIQRLKIADMVGFFTDFSLAEKEKKTTAARKKAASIED